MPIMHRSVIVLLAASAALLMPAAAAEEPVDAAALWRATYGTDELVEVSVEPTAAGRPLKATIRFQDGADVQDVLYQICEVGQSCFAIGVSMVRDGNAWTLDTSRLEEEIGRPSRETFEHGERIGVQFFVYRSNSTDERDFLPFPQGLDESHETYAVDFVAWSETHYFATTIVAAEKTTPGPSVIAAVAVVAAVALVGRRR